jgi:hypothetical protein
MLGIANVTEYSLNFLCFLYTSFPVLTHYLFVCFTLLIVIDLSDQCSSDQIFCRNFISEPQLVLYFSMNLSRYLEVIS